ncbi:MAG: hypothetical protein M1833_007096 [Piccolia ochrophora]|nr:MAG: hypothetical protein M1833_007096 [Piccolia ochrophora]
MVARKRGRQEMEAEEAPQPPSILHRIRNMWQFANLMQYLFLFGKAIRVEPDLDIEDLERECLAPGHSERLTAIGLALLKFVSSHKGLTPEIFDEYTRRQYRSRLAEHNPFGDDEEPQKFAEFDIFTKIRVLYQLSQWTMAHGERIRERMPDEDNNEQTNWRVEPVGWDAEDRTYYCLDDNRLYRQTAPPRPKIPIYRAKKNTKKAKAAARASKRRKGSGSDFPTEADGEDDAGTSTPGREHDDGLGGMKWECLAITSAEYKEFMEGIRRSKDPNEKALFKVCLETILPVVEKVEEEQERKAARKHKELLNLEKLASAKRSSRIAGKVEKQKEEEAAVETERKKRAELAMAKKEEEKAKKMEQERETRIMTREQRLKEREIRRHLHEEELANLSEDSKKLAQGENRLSERHLKAEMEKRKKALEELAQEPDWTFDCSGCGVHGENLDDGSGIIACEKCNVWQHLACLGLDKEKADQKDFQFVCSLCKRREQDKAKAAKNPLKLDFRKLGSSNSPPSSVPSKVNGDGQQSKKRKSSEDLLASPSPKKPRNHGIAASDRSGPSSSPPASSITLAGVMNGPTLSPLGQLSGASEARDKLPPLARFPPPSARPSVLSNGSLQPSDALSSPQPLPGSNTNISGGQARTYAPQPSTIPSSSPLSTTFQAPRPSSSHNAHGSPFFNSFDRQRPATPLIPSPTKHELPSTPSPASKDVGRLSLPPASGASTNLNGLSSSQPRGYSPVKQPSSSPVPRDSPALVSTATHAHSPLPSPKTGISPTKHSPSTPSPTQKSQHSFTPSALPPAPTLSPTPQRLDLTPPKKRPTPERLETNGFTSTQ